MEFYNPHKLFEEIEEKRIKDNFEKEKTNVYLNKNNDDYIALSLLNKYASSNIIYSTSISNNSFKNYYYERKRRINSLKHLYHHNKSLSKVLKKN